MKVSKDATNTAKRIFRLCLASGALNEDSLRLAMKKIVSQKPRGYREILHVLARLVRNEQRSRHVIVESAQDLDEKTRTQLQSDFTSKHGNELTFEYITTPELLGGIRIKFGDDLWDGTVKARLERIANAF